jgi:hypothetical protein
LYASVELIRWRKAENIKLEARMHSTRVVEYKGEKVRVKDLLKKNGLRPKGHQMARAISVVWYGSDLELAIVRRFDIKGRESIVFQLFRK